RSHECVHLELTETYEEVECDGARVVSRTVEVVKPRVPECHNGLTSIGICTQLTLDAEHLATNACTVRTVEVPVLFDVLLKLRCDAKHGLWARHGADELRGLHRADRRVEVATDTEWHRLAWVEERNRRRSEVARRQTTR